MIVTLLNVVNAAMSAHMIAILIGLGSLFAGWVIYDIICKSAIGKSTG